MKWKLGIWYLLLSVLTGCLLWFGWPERGFTSLLFFAFVPLLIIDADLVHRQRPYAGLKFFGYAFVAMFVWNTGTTWWIYFSTEAGAVFALLFNTTIMSLVWLSFHRCRKSFGPILGYFSFIVFWIGFEYLHLNWDLSWPWLNLGNGFATKTGWIQWYEYTGALGGSLWILSVNLLAYLFAKNILDRNEKRIRILNSILTLSGTLLLVAAPIFISHLIYQKRNVQGLPCKVVIVQPNIDPYNEKFNGNSKEQMEKFIHLASEKVDTATDFVVGPETALPDGIWEEEIYYHPQIHQLHKWIDDYPHLSLVTGLSSYKKFEANEKLTATARKFSDAEDYYDAYNSAMMLDRYGAIQLFHKSKLVPGVEKMPYPKVFGFLEKYALELGGTSGSLGKQEIRNPLVTPEGTSIAPAICYESIFGDYLSTYFRKKAELLFIVTNDGWWKNTPGHRQHMEYARLRAIEFRKDIARSANTGISCFINQRGEIMQKTTWWQPAVISATLHRNTIITFYAYHGDYIGFISAFLGALIILLLVFKRFVPSR